MVWKAALMLWNETNQVYLYKVTLFKIISIRLHFKSDGIELSEPEPKNIPLLKIEHEYFPDSFLQPLLVSAINLKWTLEITKTYVYKIIFFYINNIYTKQQRHKT